MRGEWQGGELLKSERREIAPLSNELSLRREIIATVGVLLADLAVRAVNDVLRMVIASDLSSTVDGLSLRAMDGRGPVAAGAHVRPPTLVRYRVDVTLAQWTTPPLPQRRSGPLDEVC